MCERVELGLITQSGEALKLSALVVPLVCDPMNSQPISHSRDCYEHLLGLILADSADSNDSLTVDMLEPGHWQGAMRKE